MAGFRDVAPRAALVVAIAASGAGCGGGESPSGDNRNVDISQKTEKVIDDLCSRPPYGTNEYRAKVGSHLFEQIGTSKGQDVSFDNDRDDVARDVSKVDAPNTLGVATYMVFQNASKGVAPESVKTAVNELFLHLDKNEGDRKKACGTVLARMAAAPFVHKTQSPSGDIAEFKPAYAANDAVTGVDTVVTPNNAAMNLFSIGAIDNSPNETLQRGISTEYGQRADGGFFMVVHKEGHEGDSKPSESGSPAAIQEAKQLLQATLQDIKDSTKAPADSTENNAKDDNGKGKTPHGGGSSQHTPDSQGGGVSAGPNSEHATTGPNAGPGVGRSPEASPGTDDTPNSGSTGVPATGPASPTPGAGTEGGSPTPGTVVVSQTPESHPSPTDVPSPQPRPSKTLAPSPTPEEEHTPSPTPRQTSPSPKRTDAPKPEPSETLQG